MPIHIASAVAVIVVALALLWIMKRRGFGPTTVLAGVAALTLTVGLASWMLIDRARRHERDTELSASDPRRLERALVRYAQAVTEVVIDRTPEGATSARGGDMTAIARYVAALWNPDAGVRRTAARILLSSQHPLALDAVLRLIATRWTDLDLPGHPGGDVPGEEAAAMLAEVPGTRARLVKHALLWDKQLVISGDDQRWILSQSGKQEVVVAGGAQRGYAWVRDGEPAPTLSARQRADSVPLPAEAPPRGKDDF